MKRDGYNPCNNINDNSDLLLSWQGRQNDPAFPWVKIVGHTKVLNLSILFKMEMRKMSAPDIEMYPSERNSCGTFFFFNDLYRLDYHGLFSSKGQLSQVVLR